MFRFPSKRLLRNFSTTHRRLDEAATESKDFRPPWVYTFARIGSNASILTVFVYSIFFYDFGNDDHVFQPVRKWAAQHTASLFSLSPAEERLIDSEKRKAEANGDSKSVS
ncbi:hypothetical protein GYMLUDRAFT_45451 [Collybiopsis luxurians FD-317 M1]|uniref:Uncharacterized protein n=1 Tax=Collybiopsis luxurians FD-317 M1 TaxID=944289 RepID=A0A0D0B4K5_9AGAR|nr:hypothetical protein GYMLUDRAFT_45451 [Collybiopsis luxurians FD-317 M1]